MSSKKILIVEDEPIIAIDLKETLVSLGYSVSNVIASADDLFNAYAQEKPDLVLMDIKLKSYIDGIDAARRLRMISKVPIIYLTAFSNEETQRRAAGTQPVAFLSKPVNEAILAQEIKKALA